MMLGKRHSKEDFFDVLDDLKRLFSTGKSQVQRRFDFISKKSLTSSRSEIRGVFRTPAVN